jgi:ribosomal protein L7Ae-like RNA K-turn-binding protein
MNSKQRRWEEKRLYSNSQYSVLPLSSADITVDTIKKMGKDYIKMKGNSTSNSNNNDNNKRICQTFSTAPSNPFVIGSNAVTRAVEKNELQIVVMSGKTKKMYIQHIPALCHNMKCQWSTKMELSREDLGNFFGIKRITMFGLKKKEGKKLDKDVINNNVNRGQCENEKKQSSNKNKCNKRLRVNEKMLHNIKKQRKTG